MHHTTLGTLHVSAQGLGCMSMSEYDGRSEVSGERHGPLQAVRPPAQP